LSNPRHVEIQVLGDQHGNIVHLGERECSIQRRNQKIIEEAPSTAVDAALRAEMGAQAVALAQAVGYDSAGTVEFILGADRHFYFLEMNTRLQVEHPVTEFITGLDLVEQMIRVAAGEMLGFTQEDVRFDGWAVETRLYAEDPGRNFIPSIGQISRYHPPAAGRRADGTAVRVDDGVREDITIPIYFDPLMAKLITHGPDRASAVEAMADALDCFVVDGIAHNLSFLSAIMANKRWQRGDLSTSFVAEEYPHGFAAAKLDPGTLARMAMVALAIAIRRRHRFRAFDGRLNGEGSVWRSDWSVAIGGTHFALRVEPSAEPDTLTMVHDGGDPVVVASDWRPGDVLWTGVIGHHAVNVQVRQADGGVHLTNRGIAATARVMTPRVAELDRLMPVKKSKHSANQLRCPMPGLVVAIDAAEGQEVRAGDILAVVEAMKMENVLRAERDGTVKRIVAKAGDTLAVDAVIMEFA
jgi:propionyl-CoA carboxylase alpha chain